MIEFEEACELIFENVNQLDADERLIEKTAGYVLAQDVESPINVAPFRNSAKDGFAVKSQWLEACSAENPCIIPIGATVFAGEAVSEGEADLRALKVMTGARVPDEFDTVVPFEDTEYNKKDVKFLRPVISGENVRPPGEDIARNQRLYDKGTRLGRLDIGVLASIGMRSVLIYRKPSVLIIGTGDELIDPGKELTGNSIYDSNTFTLAALVEPYSDRTERVCRVPDTNEALQQVLRSPHDVIVTSGAVSAGERDLIPEVAESCGWQTIFHKVRIKPGKPVYFARRDKQVLFGLPGNPLSTAVTCSIFLIPALKKMAGFRDYRLVPEPAALDPESFRKSGRKLIWPGFIKQKSDGMVVSLSPKKSSAALSALLNTDGLIFQDRPGGETGEVIVRAVYWHQILDF